MCGTQVTPAFSDSVAIAEQLRDAADLDDRWAARNRSRRPRSSCGNRSGSWRSRPSPAARRSPCGAWPATRNPPAARSAPRPRTDWTASWRRPAPRPRPAVQPQLVSTMIGMSGPGDLARGRDRLGGALVQLDVLVAALERARGVALHVLDVAGVLQQRRVGLDALALRRRRAASTPRRLRACRGCPTARCRGR